MTTEVNDAEMMSADIPIDQEHQSEKLIPQSKVNQLIGEAKRNAAQKGYKQAISELQQSNLGSNDTRDDTVNVNHSTGNVSDIRKIIAEELQANQKQIQDQIRTEQAHQHHQKVITELASKINVAAEKTPDYAETLSQVNNFSETPLVLHYANMVDNAGEVLYELAKNPNKAVQIISAIQSGSPSIAKSLVNSLSKSIKNNQQASSDKIPDEPLSQLKPSNLGIGKAPSDASDLVRKYKGRY